MFQRNQWRLGKSLLAHFDRAALLPSSLGVVRARRENLAGQNLLQHLLDRRAVDRRMQSEDVIQNPAQGKDVGPRIQFVDFAISQLPKERSVPMLVDIARSNKSPSVRKKAIFWLGQSGDPAAIKFFEEILLKK